MQAKLTHNGTTHNMFNIYADGRLEIPFGSMKPPYGAPEARRELLLRLDMALGGGVLPADHENRLPQVSLEPLLTKARLVSFLAVWENFVNEVHAWDGSTHREDSATGG